MCYHWLPGGTLVTRGIDIGYPGDIHQVSSSKWYSKWYLRIPCLVLSISQWVYDIFFYIVVSRSPVIHL